MPLLSAILRRLIRSGHLCVIDAPGRHHYFGETEATMTTIRLNDKSVAREQLAKRIDTLPLARDYMIPAEKLSHATAIRTPAHAGSIVDAA